MTTWIIKKLTMLNLNMLVSFIRSNTLFFHIICTLNTWWSKIDLVIMFWQLHFFGCQGFDDYIMRKKGVCNWPCNSLYLYVVSANGQITWIVEL